MRYRITYGDATMPVQIVAETEHFGIACAICDLYKHMPDVMVMDKTTTSTRGWAVVYYPGMKGE